MISIRTNYTSLRAQRNLNHTMQGTQETITCLSTGHRINKAADDAAGLAISDKLVGDIRSYAQASRNVNDAISLLQTAESGLSDITSMLHRLRELSMQSASDGITDTERAYVQTEVTELLSEVDRIASDTEFNGVAILDGTLSADFQTGLDSGKSVNIAIGSPLTAAGLGIGGLDLSGKAGALTGLGDIDSALEGLNSIRSYIGAMENRMGVVHNRVSSHHDALFAANSRIRDVDIANATADMTNNQILLQAGSAMLAQANSIPQVALSLLGG